MEALFIVLNHEAHFDELIRRLAENNIRGGTILSSEGLAATLAEHSHDLGLQYFRLMLNEGRPYNKTMFLLLEGERLEIAKQCVRDIVGDIKKENVGIMFSIKVSSFEGLNK